jgi:uncharacterized protein
MHLKEEQIHRLAEKILNDLVAAEEVVLKAERGAIIAAIKSAVSADLQAEDSLEKDAERIQRCGGDRSAQDAEDDQGAVGKRTQDNTLGKEVEMNISEDRVSHIAHRVLDKVWKNDLVDFPREPRALLRIKMSLSEFFASAEEIDQLVRRKLASYAQAKVPGSRDWEILYKKFSEEEAAKRR